MKYYYLIPIILYSISCPGQIATPDFAGVKYGPEARQFLDLYIVSADEPTPVYFDAHGNGGDTRMPSQIIEDLREEGIATVAWESYTSVNSQESVESAWEDAELMFSWVKENAEVYNFDTTKFIIGGSSRGSILSWKYSHSGKSSIKGLYMYNALPSNVWGDPTWWYPPDDVKTTSPPIFFVYKREPGASQDPIDPDIHDPNNGFTIMDQYEALGIGDLDTLVHSIGETDNSDKYQFLVEFAQSVLSDADNPDADIILNIPGKSNTWQVFPNPFQKEFQISGLQGDEHFRLQSIDGSILLKGSDLAAINVDLLSQGIYLLTVQNARVQRTFRLIKQ